MKRHLQGLFALWLLLSQAGWLDHLYHQHDLNHEEACELCLLGHAQNHGIAGSGILVHQISTCSNSPLTGPASDHRIPWAGLYFSRAPPSTVRSDS